MPGIFPPVRLIAQRSGCAKIRRGKEAVTLEFWDIWVDSVGATGLSFARSRVEAGATTGGSASRSVDRFDITAAGTETVLLDPMPTTGFGRGGCTSPRNSPTTTRA